MLELRSGRTATTCGVVTRSLVFHGDPSLPCAEPRRFGQALTDRSSLAPAPATRRPRRPHAGAAAAVAAECRRQGVRREGLPHQDGDHVSARDQGSCSAARPSEARGFARADAATCGRRAVARADALLAAASKSAAARTSLRRFRRRGASAASIACACLLAPRHSFGISFCMCEPQRDVSTNRFLSTNWASVRVSVSSPILSRSLTHHVHGHGHAHT